MAAYIKKAPPKIILMEKYRQDGREKSSKVFEEGAKLPFIWATTTSAWGIQLPDMAVHTSLNHELSHGAFVKCITTCHIWVKD